jgi:CrcB protein
MNGLSLTSMLAVMGGAAVGALLRWWAVLWLNSADTAFPMGTLLVNCAGGLLMGLAMAYFENQPNQMFRLLLVTGFLGGLTTFSAFSGESLLMLQRGQWTWAVLHTLAHVVGALGCAALGFKLAR